jgi:ribosome maturation factor RimP
MAKEDVAGRVAKLLEPFLSENELELYKAEYKKEGPAWVLRVSLEKPVGAKNEYVSIEECEKVNAWLSEALDKDDFIDRSYNLEVSSPGLDRELIHETDYVRFAGREVEVRTYQQIEGSKNFEGTLVGKEDNIVIIEAAGKRLEIPAEKISKINLAVVF